MKFIELTNSKRLAAVDTIKSRKEAEQKYYSEFAFKG